MNKKSFQATLIATAISALCSTVQAAGLGAIHVHSGIGQPLRAEIPVQASAGELDSLSARVPPPEVFREADVDYSPVMGQLQLSVDRSGSRPVVRVSSQRPVNDPFVEMLVELSWATGRLVREFTFLLDPVDAPPRPAAAATVDTPRASRPAAPSPQTDTGAHNYTVQRGDTLGRIAARHRPDGVNLDQVLVALFRDNPDAFAGGNMNRLQAGAVLSIPDAERIGAVHQSDARREIAAQSSDFEAYRRGLAAAAASSERSEARQESPREQTGTITPRTEETADVARQGDRVEISGAEDDDASGEPAARLEGLEEELASREHALQETHERLEALESSIRDLQRLLELRNRTLAQLQQQLAEHGEIVGLPAADVLAAEAADEVRRDEDDELVSAGAPDLTGPAQSQTPAGGPGGEASPGQSQGLVQHVMADRAVWLGGAAILALLLGYAAYRLSARRKVEEHGLLADEAGIEHAPAGSAVASPRAEAAVEAQSALLDSEFGQSGEAAIDADEAVDPVAEADVYMAYGRDAQAEEILRDALEAAPSHLAAKLKLLEVYARRQDRRLFEELATDVRAQTDGEGQEWQQAAAMGRELDPKHPLYRLAGKPDAEAASSSAGPDGRPVAAAGGAAAGAAGVATGVAAAKASSVGAAVEPSDAAEEHASELFLEDLEFTPSADAFARESAEEASGGESGERNGDSEEQDFLSLDFDLDESKTPFGAEPAQATEASPTTGDGSETAQDRAFSRALDELEAELPDVTGAGTEAVRQGEQGWLEETVVGDGLRLADSDERVSDTAASAPGHFDSMLDFDLDMKGAEQAEREAPKFDFSGIDLDLDSPPEQAGAKAADSESLRAESDESEAFSGEVLEEVETKLDLARAYEEMGDKQGARELIDEVLKEGSPDQREAASRLLERVG